MAPTSIRGPPVSYIILTWQEQMCLLFILHIQAGATLIMLHAR